MQRFKNIVFIIDSELKEIAALERVVSLAENNQAALTVVLIFKNHPVGYNKKIQGISITELEDSIIEKRQAQLESLVAQYRNRLNINICVLTGIPFMAVIREVLRHDRELVIKTEEKENQIDLIIMGTVGRKGIPGFLMGNTAEAVLNHIDCSILAIKPESFISPVTLESE